MQQADFPSHHFRVRVADRPDLKGMWPEQKARGPEEMPWTAKTPTLWQVGREPEIKLTRFPHS